MTIRPLDMTIRPLGLAIALSLHGASLAQPTQDELRERRAAKLAEPFVAHVPWERSWERAMERARGEGRLVLGYFTRSYAPCPPCKQLEGGPFVSDWWKAIATEVVPYLNVHARLPDDVDVERLEQTGGTGFPHVVFLDANATVLRIFRPSSEEAFREALDSARTLHALGEHCAKHPEDRDAQVRYRLDRLRVLDDEGLFEELRALMARGEVARETRQRYRDYLAHRTIVRFWNDHRDATRRLPAEEAQRAYASWSLRALELWQRGVQPPKVELTYLSFVYMVFEGALAESDRETARAALEWARTLAKQEPRITEQIEALEKRLDG